MTVAEVCDVSARGKLKLAATEMKPLENRMDREINDAIRQRMGVS